MRRSRGNRSPNPNPNRQASDLGASGRREPARRNRIGDGHGANDRLGADLMERRLEHGGRKRATLDPRGKGELEHDADGASTDRVDGWAADDAVSDRSDGEVIEHPSRCGQPVVTWTQARVLSALEVEHSVEPDRMNGGAASLDCDESDPTGDSTQPPRTDGRRVAIADCCGDAEQLAWLAGAKGPATGGDARDEHASALVRAACRTEISHVFGDSVPSGHQRWPSAQPPGPQTDRPLGSSTRRATPSCVFVRTAATLLCVVLGGCGASNTPAQAPPTSKTFVDSGTASSTEDAVASITAARLEAIVDVLADDDLEGRKTPSPGLDEAARFIATQFDRLGLEALDAAPNYLQTFDCGGSSPSSNVVGLLRGKTLEPLVAVTAHYDHLGTKVRGDDRIYNGANDNASGVASMLMVAQALRQDPTPTQGSVLFVAFCGEELGFKGSKHFVSAPPMPLSELDVVVNLEMLGRPTSQDPPAAWVTGFAYSDFASIFAAAATASAKARIIDPATLTPIEADAFGRSDNLPFAEAGVIAHTIAAGVIDDHYHAVDDEPELLDFQRMSPLVQMIAVGTRSLADGAATTLSWSQSGRAAGFGR